MQGQELAVEATKAAMNSYNSAIEENERYQRSLEARLNKVKNAGTELALALGEDALTDIIITTTDLIIALANAGTFLTENFGSLPSTFALVGVAALGLSRNFRILSSSVLFVDVAIKKLNISSKLLATTLRGLLLVSGVGTILVGIGFVIDKLLERYVKFREESRQFEQEQQKIADAWTNQRDKINELLLQYNELYNITNRTTEQEQQYLEVQQQLANLLPNLIDHIDEKGQVHLKTGEALQQELEYAQKLAELESGKRIIEFEDDFKNIINEIKDLQDKIRIDKSILSDPDFFLTDKQIHEIETRIIGAQRIVSAKFYELEQKILTHIKNIANIDFSETVVKQIQNIINSLDISQLTNFVDSGFIIEFANALSYLYRAFELNDETAISSAIQNLYNVASAAGVAEEKIDQLYKAFLKAPEAAQSTDSISDALNNAINKVIEFDNNISDLVDAYNELNEGNQLSAKRILELVNKYDELSSAVEVQNGMLTINKEAILEVMNAEEAKTKAALEGERKELENQEKTLRAKLSLYQKEIEGIESVAQARSVTWDIVSQEVQKELDKIRARGFEPTPFDEENITRAIFQKYEPDLTRLGQIAEAKRKIDALLNSDLTKSAISSKSRSSSAREQQKAEALDAIDLSHEEINAINAVIKTRDKNIESLERQIKTAEKANDYNKAIQLTNQLIEQQKLKIQDILSANQELHNRAEAVRKKYASIGQQFAKNGILFEKWFDSSGQATEDFIKYIESFEKKSQQIVNSNLSEAEKKRQIDALKEQRDLAMDIFSILQRYKLAWLQNADAMQATKDEIDALKEKNKEYYEEIRRQQEEIRKANEDLYDDWISEVEDLARNIVDIYKEVYEAQRDAELENIEKMIDAEEKRHEKRIKNIEDEYEKFERTINDMIKLIDREFEEQEYQDELASLQKEEAELLKQINQLALDDSIEAKARREELEKELADTRTEIEKLQRERTREIRKQSLEDLLENERREVEAKKEAENRKYELERERLENMRDERRKYWDNLINDESRFLQIESQIINGSINNIIKDMDNFKNTIMSISNTIGEAIQKNIINKIENLRQQLQTVTKTKPSGVNYYVPQTEYEKQAIEQMKKNSEKWRPDLPTEIRKKLEQENQIWGKSIGATYNAAEGRWYKNGLPLYHEGGLVGESNSPIAEALHRILNLNSLEQLGILRKGEFVISNPLRAFNNLMNLRIPKIIPQTQVVSGGDTINLNFRIERLVGNENGAKTLFNIIHSELKKRGK